LVVVECHPHGSGRRCRLADAVVLATSAERGVHFGVRHRRHQHQTAPRRGHRQRHPAYERILQRIANQNGGTRASGTPGFDASAAYVRLQPIVDAMVEGTMLKRAATLEDVGNAAVFAASDWARTMTATALNLTGGAELH
jgi:hypothetical protein